MFIDRVRRERKAIVIVRLFPLCFLNRLTFELDFFVYMGHDDSSPGVESQGHRSRSKVNV